MTRAAILAAVVLVAATARADEGTWVRADGDEVPMRCPAADEYHDRTRLPRGCTAERPGVLYTVDADAWVAARATLLRGREAQAVELTAQLRREQDRHAATRDAAAALAAELEEAADALEEAQAERNAALQGAGGVAWADALAGVGVGVVVGAMAVAVAMALR